VNRADQFAVIVIQNATIATESATSPETAALAVDLALEVRTVTVGAMTPVPCRLAITVAEMTATIVGAHLSAGVEARVVKAMTGVMIVAKTTDVITVVAKMIVAVVMTGALTIDVVAVDPPLRSTVVAVIRAADSAHQRFAMVVLLVAVALMVALTDADLHLVARKVIKRKTAVWPMRVRVLTSQGAPLPTGSRMAELLIILNLAMPASRRMVTKSDLNRAYSTLL